MLHPRPRGHPKCHWPESEPWTGLRGWVERGQAGPAQTAPHAPVPTQAASTVSVTVVSEPPTRQRRQRAPGAEGRPQPPVLCCRHLPVPDHLVQQLHRLACHLLWLQLRVGSGGGAQGPRISLRPPASSLAFHHLARVGWTCLALWTCGHTIPCPCPRRSSVQWETAVQGLLHYM